MITLFDNYCSNSLIHADYYYTYLKFNFVTVKKNNRQMTLTVTAINNRVYENNVGTLNQQVEGFSLGPLLFMVHESLSTRVTRATNC